MTSDFETEIAALAKQSKKTVEKGSAEEKTKHSVIMPFIKALGYNIHDDDEVDPESQADSRTQKQVDYTIKINGSPIMLIEAKHAVAKLASHWEQLFEYFARNTNLSVAVLANGKEAWFYSDLDNANLMDDEPFFKFNFQQNSEKNRDILQLFHKDKFDASHIKKMAYKIREFTSVKQYISDNIAEPSNEFTTFIRGQISNKSQNRNDPSTLQESIKEAFAEITGEQNLTTITIKAKSPVQSADKNVSMRNANQQVNKKIRTMVSPKTFLNNEQDFREAYKEVISGYENEFKIKFEGVKKTIFVKYLTMIHSLGNISENDLKTCVKFYRDGIPFVSMLLWKKALQIGLNIDVAEINDPRNICIDRKGKNKNGVGDTCTNIYEYSDHDYVFGLIEQAYNGRRNNNANYSRPIAQNQRISNIVTPNLSDPIAKYRKLENGSANQYIHICNEPMKTTFLRYVKEISNLGNVEEKILETAVLYSKGGKNFTSIQPGQRTLKIGLKIRIEEIHDPRGLCEDRSGKGYLGIGDTFLKIDTYSDLDYVLGLIRQAYQKCGW